MTPMELLDRTYTPDAQWPAEPPPVEVIVNGREVPHDIGWCLYRIAVASLAGDWLDTATTTEEGREAMAHGESLHGAGVLSDD
ncbi:MAG: hypothetical protein ACYC3X_29615 [Pirellulaceae bacterium]